MGTGKGVVVAPGRASFKNAHAPSEIGGNGLLTGVVTYFSISYFETHCGKRGDRSEIDRGALLIGAASLGFGRVGEWLFSWRYLFSCVGPGIFSDKIPWEQSSPDTGHAPLWVPCGLK